MSSHLDCWSLQHVLVKSKFHYNLVVGSSWLIVDFFYFSLGLLWFKGHQNIHWTDWSVTRNHKRLDSFFFHLDKSHKIERRANMSALNINNSPLNMVAGYRGINCVTIYRQTRSTNSFFAHIIYKIDNNIIADWWSVML